MSHSLKLFKPLLLASALAALTACDGDDGNDGRNGVDGQDGPRGEQGPAGAPGTDGAPGVDGADGDNGVNSLVTQTPLLTGDTQCTKGGVRVDSGPDNNADGVLDAGEITATSYLCNPGFPNTSKHFNRIATFASCEQGDACDTDDETSTEIVAASSDGMTLIYTDSPGERLGFVDITDPANPAAAGTLALSGEPTSVAVKDGYALVGINSSADYINVSGSLAVIDIATQTLVTEIDMAGQPDSVAVSPDGMYAVIAIENERDEDLGEGVPPQAPAGFINVVNLSGEPSAWSNTQVDVTGLSGMLYADDPEPEYVDINSDNVAVVTLQENNHIVLVDLASATVTNHFSAGSASLTQIDTQEEEPAIISLTESEADILREPDGVAWINNTHFATADEGDLDGGSRTFTVFNTNGDVVYNSGSDLDHMTVRYGHYQDARSGNKGNEPENIEVGVYGSDRYLFVASERSSMLFVYDATDPANPLFKQALPAALGPEGVLAIPSRNLLIAASEEDARDDKFRAGLNIYNYSSNEPAYPTIASSDRADSTPIPWSALSGLAASATDANTLYAVDDSYYQKNRIFVLDTSSKPAKLTDEIYLTDSNDVFAGFTAASLADASVDDDDATRLEVFDEADLAAAINSDKTINIDPEGVAVASAGGFWVASEGSGTIGDAGRPINSLNWVFKTDASGVIEQVFTLPDAVNANQVRFGFEGITEHNGLVYVAMQRAWTGDSEPRIAVLNPADGSWQFFFYPLDTTSRGWVGLSDITAIGNGQFLVLERDNQAGPDASIKRIYSVDVTGASDGDTLTKTLVKDLIPALEAHGGLVAEKVEGMAKTTDGDVYIVNDNDGVDDNSGETLLINLGSL